MQSNEDRSIVPQPSRELAAPPIGANRILGEMVRSSLALANVDIQEAELDALVREAKRLQVGGAVVSGVVLSTIIDNVLRPVYPAAKIGEPVPWSFAIGARAR